MNDNEKQIPVDGGHFSRRKIAALLVAGLGLVGGGTVAVVSGGHEHKTIPPHDASTTPGLIIGHPGDRRNPNDVLPREHDGAIFDYPSEFPPASR